MMMVLMTVFTSAFLTLHESTLISSTQSSMGPHQTSVMAILQPISDAFKLITKSTTYPSFKMVMPPIFCLMLTILSTFVMFSTKSILPFYAIQSLTIYAFISTAIYSSSSYTMISMPSIISQLISYEILYSFLILSPFISTSVPNNTHSLYNMFSYTNLTSSPFKFTIIPFILFITILAETNSTPFDLPESESELVAGFLTEYSAIPFMIYQLTEYMSIVVSSFLIYSIYAPSPSMFTSSMMSLLIMSLIILSSTTFPSFKYSSTISLSWKDLAILTVVLPLTSLY